MKLKCDETTIQIVPENAIERVYLETIMGDSVKAEAIHHRNLLPDGPNNPPITVLGDLLYFELRKAKP